MQRILVIDDNPDIQRLVRTLLGRAGYKPFVAGGLGEALALAEQARPHAVLVDIARGYHDPAEPLELLRASGWLGGAPVIAVSGRPDLDRSVALALGYAAFLAKPFHIDSLVAQIAAALARPPGRVRWQAC